jgi:hypothetical protein
MVPRKLLVLAVLVLPAKIQAVEVVGVRGSAARFTTTMEATHNKQTVQLVLTGTAVRQKYFLNVYALASYVQQGASVHTAEELAACDAVKRLVLVLERPLEGKTLAEALRAGVRLNHAEPAFAAELDRLSRLLTESETFKRGDYLYLTYLPGVGLHCSLAGKGEHLIENPAFAQAVWAIYLGKNNIGETIKKGLVSRLK